MDYAERHHCPPNLQYFKTMQDPSCEWKSLKSSTGEHWRFPMMFPLEEGLLLGHQWQLTVLPLTSQDQHLFPRVSFKVLASQFPEVLSCCTQCNARLAVTSIFFVKNFPYVITSRLSGLSGSFWCLCSCDSTQSLHELRGPRHGRAGPSTDHLFGGTQKPGWDVRLASGGLWPGMVKGLPEVASQDWIWPPWSFSPRLLREMLLGLHRGQQQQHCTMNLQQKHANCIIHVRVMGESNRTKLANQQRLNIFRCRYFC